MKKLLILFIVLSLATSARATPVTVTLVAHQNGTNAITVNQYDTVTVDLISTDTTCTGISDTDEGDPGWWITADAGIALPADGRFPEDVLDPIEILSTSLDRIMGIFTVPVAADDWIFAFDVDADTIGTFDVYVNFDPDYGSFWDEAANDRWEDVTIGDPLTITVIPEPMTIALLALGGLILLGRRKYRI